jgi:cholesterol transport system auxiliary component
MRILFLLALLLAGCAPFGETKQAHRYFVLDPVVEAGSLPVRLGSVTSATFYDTDAIVYSRSTGTRGYYQQNSWTEPPARRIAELLAPRASGKGPALHLRLVEMYHDAAASPGIVRVSLAAELDGRRRTFTTAVPAAGFDAAGAVKGFNEAVGKALGELAQWVAE